MGQLGSAENLGAGSQFTKVARLGRVAQKSQHGPISRHGFLKKEPQHPYQSF